MNINKNQDNNNLGIAKKYKLSFLGTSPKHDWFFALFLFFVLIMAFSVAYYFEKVSVKKSISGDNLVREEKIYFDITKAENLLKEFETKRSVIDQSL